MKHFSFIDCPLCGKVLIDLDPLENGEHEYFCDDCLITIQITDEDEEVVK